MSNENNDSSWNDQADIQTQNYQTDAMYTNHTGSDRTDWNQHDTYTDTDHYDSHTNSYPSMANENTNHMGASTAHGSNVHINYGESDYLSHDENYQVHDNYENQHTGCT